MIFYILRIVLKSMKEIWDQCGQETKDIQSQLIPTDYDTYQDETAEELLYDYAMRLVSMLLFSMISDLQEIIHS